ncbi:glycosyl hydrolase family 3 [Cyanobium sp. Alchichica 3B3-8F6]|uniref:glycoside hydrolase family 3 N-terminal domain-containing protein n=1 Tax=Cyanobium sp. Alchichica 3B3-8F6 TaxID=2823696 RepID=UPI0020CE3481|nr:glycoside hydrolase family 3 N-terminal domain-containing protein [Cyanobium sp. Alchichica 3B3-8F6]MCP9882361.1 glycosyl hydrolase family 3 [Cyanobium sp. Alchichica 3B3-8F6]
MSSEAAPDPALLRLIHQLLVVRASGTLADHQRGYPRWELPNAQLRALLEAGVGGVILLGGSAAEVALRCAQLRRWAGQPLLLCADVEEGVGQRFDGATWLVPPLALGRLYRQEPQRAVALAECYGRCTGRDARALGLNWVLGPVCDVNNNPANPVINVRAWGDDQASAGALAAAFVRGAQSEKVLACAKHFPGHGDTSSDSHLTLPLLPHSRERLAAIELPPFEQAIAAGVASVMTAHLMLPALDPERPATLSRPVLSGLLRQQLGFGGLVVTDALVMEAITGRYGAGEAAVLALEAGADLVLMPADAAAAIAAIAEAVHSGRLSRDQLEASAERRRRALACCAEPAAAPDPEAAAQPDQALALELVIATLEASLEATPDGGRTATDPRAGQPGINLIRLDSALAAAFLPATAPALSRPEARGWRSVLLESRSPSLWSGVADAPLALEHLGPGPVLLQLFVRGNPFRGSAGSAEPWPAALRQLVTAGRLAGVVVYGSPYLWEELQPLLPAGIPGVYSPGQMPLAQAEALNRLGRGLGLGDTEAGAGFTD